MKYISTRGRAPVLDFGDVLLAGLASDGGLYVPDSWPRLPDSLPTEGYAPLAVEVMGPFVDGTISRPRFGEIVDAAYQQFSHPDVAPLVELSDGLWLMELFHGPTLAFKDIAMQLVGRLFDEELTRRGENVTIVGATSGDTGSAAIEAVRDRENIQIVILHPYGRVSEVQRRQMTTVPSANVHNVAIEGTFDDCQDLVKAMFGDAAFRDRHRLSAVNSINWARVMAQTVYYVAAAAHLGPGLVSFSVPTGNFGNVLAGHVARKMGLNVDRFVVASNRNDILTQFFTEGRMTISEVHPTLSPSMDIQVSSNLERLLFDLLGRDGLRTAQVMDDFRATGEMQISPEMRAELAQGWAGVRVDDAQTTATIADLYHDKGMVIDPHTAVGLAASRQFMKDSDSPMVVLSTAHPAKFADAVGEAIGLTPPLPEHLADLAERPERCELLPNDLAMVQAHVARCSSEGKEALSGGPPPAPVWQNRSS